MADVAEIDCDRFADVDVDNIMSRVQRRPLTFTRTRCLYKAPEFIKRFSSDEPIEEGSGVRLDCRIKSFPRPHLRWFKDDEEITRDLDNHPRIHVESLEDGVYELVIDDVNRGDEGTYRCKAENAEGSCASLFYLSVRVKSPRRSKSQSPSRRTVSFAPFVPTIVEKVDEEEKAAKEVSAQPPSPLTPLYEDNKLRTGTTWPNFLGDWAYVQIRVNSVSFDSDAGDDCVNAEDEVFSNMIELAVVNREGDYQTVTPPDDITDCQTMTPSEDINSNPTMTTSEEINRSETETTSKKIMDRDTGIPSEEIKNYQTGSPTKEIIDSMPSPQPNMTSSQKRDWTQSSENVEVKSTMISKYRKRDDLREEFEDDSNGYVVCIPKKTKTAKDRPVALVKPTREGFKSDETDATVNDTVSNKDGVLNDYPEKPKKGTSYKDTQSNLKVVSKIFYLSSPTQELLSCPRYEGDSRPLDSLPEELVYFPDGDRKFSSPEDETIICTSHEVPYNQKSFNNMIGYSREMVHLPEEYLLYPLIEEDGESPIEEQIKQHLVLPEQSSRCSSPSRIQPASHEELVRELREKSAEYRSRSPINLPVSKSECVFVGTVKYMPRRPCEFRYYNQQDAHEVNQKSKRSPQRDKNKARVVTNKTISGNVSEHRTVPVERSNRVSSNRHKKEKHKGLRHKQLENVQNDLNDNVGSKRRPLEVTSSPKSKGVVKTRVPFVTTQTRSFELLSRDFLLVSGFTYFSLLLDMPPEDFVVNILFAFIIYSISLRISKLCKIFDSVD